MKKAFLFIFILIQIYSELPAQDTLRYGISFPNLTHHEADVQLSYVTDDTDTLVVRMSSSSPGRYAPHQFVKNIYNLRAYQNEEEIQIIRTAPDAWHLPVKRGTLKIEYTLFANHPDGTYSGFDEKFALINIPSVFIWLEGKEDLPVSLRFYTPEERHWKVGTQLVYNKHNHTYIAPNLDYFMDSPVLLTDYQEEKFSIADTDGSLKQFTIAINPPVEAQVADLFTQMTKKFIREHQAVYGTLADFDYGKYIFLCSYGAPYFGDGMEHRNSTMITSGYSLPGNEKRLVETLAHEFFHSWNVERLRPSGLEPFYFTRPDMSNALWFAEGFTSYYSYLDLCRSGIYSVNDFLREISSNLNYVINSPGRLVGGPAYMSEMAPFVDAAVWIDDMNVDNIFISYYSYGLVTGLELDLMLRSEFKNLSLDDLMRSMWQKYGKTEIPYTLENIRDALAELTGNQEFADSFFQKYVYDSQLPDFKQLLSLAGFILRSKYPGRVYLGNPILDFNETRARLTTYTLKDTPLYDAGLDKNDVIALLDQKAVPSYDTIKSILQNHVPGDTLSIEFLHWGKQKTSQLILDPDPSIEVIPVEKGNEKLNRAAEAFRNNWLGSKANQ